LQIGATVLFFSIFYFQFEVFNFQFLCSSVRAQEASAQDQPEPPVRLKKKVKPPPAADQRPESQKEEPKPKKIEQPKPAEPKEDGELDLQNAQGKLREIANRIAKNMSQVEERLLKNDSGDVTQQTQTAIVCDLDQLIEQTRRQQQQQQQSRSSSSSSSQRDQQARRNRSQQSQASANREESQQNNQGGNNPRGGRTGQDEMSKIADLYKDVWGHLPETLRQEMDQYSREQFMAKYNELLKQYYSTIAEKGRRKDSAR
jgi:hypothetical protein